MFLKFKFIEFFLTYLLKNNTLISPDLSLVKQQVVIFHFPLVLLFIYTYC